jgi:chaperonin GroEL
MSKNVTFSPEARRRFLAGVAQLADAVTVTLGPKGRHVLLDRTYGPPIATKDGVTVAKEFDLEDPIEKLGADMVRDVAEKTSEIGGDGTTTSVILARAILTEGVRLAAAGHDLLSLKRGIDKAVAAVVARLREISMPAGARRELSLVATIAANGDQHVGDLVGDTIEKIGKEGVLTIEDGRTLETTVEIFEGYDIDKGYLSPYFATDKLGTRSVLENAFVLIHEAKLQSLAPFVPLLDAIAGLNRPLLVIADSLDDEVLGTLLTNNGRKTLRSAAVQAPGFGEDRRDILFDIGAVTGGRVVTNEVELRLGSVKVTDLGQAKKVVVERTSTTIIGGRGSKEDIERRARNIRSRMEKVHHEFEREKLEQRLAKLLAGIGVIHVGGATEIDMKERKYMVENAICAARAALSEGILPGGGVALLRAAAALDDLEVPDEEQPGVAIVRRALEDPLRWIARNAGAEASVVVERVRKGKGAFGFNAAGERFEDLVEAGIVDSTKVVRLALENAASVASMLLTAEAALAQGPTYEKDYLDPPKVDHKKMKLRAAVAKDL